MSNSTWNNLSNIAGWIGVVVACVSLYFQFFNKDHEMSLSVTSFEVAKDELVIGVIYKNSGDYQEAILNGGIILDELNSKGELSGVKLHFNLADCFTPIVLEPNGIHHKYYKVSLRSSVIYEEHVIEATISSAVSATFYFLLPDNRIGSERFNLGDVAYGVKEGNIQEFEVTENNHEFDFLSNRNFGLGRATSHSNPKYDVNHCEKEI